MQGTTNILDWDRASTLIARAAARIGPLPEGFVERYESFADGRNLGTMVEAIRELIAGRGVLVCHMKGETHGAMTTVYMTDRVEHDGVRTHQVGEITDGISALEKRTPSP